MAATEELPCGCVITPYSITKAKFCRRSHVDRMNALLEWRKRRIWRLYDK
jgi:hypothetical protein